MQERIQEDGNVSVQKKRTRVGMRGHTLEESESVAHSIRLVSCESGRIDGRIDADHLENNIYLNKSILLYV